MTQILSIIVATLIGGIATYIFTDILHKKDDKRTRAHDFYSNYLSMETYVPNSNLLNMFENYFKNRKTKELICPLKDTEDINSFFNFAKNKYNNLFNKDVILVNQQLNNLKLSYSYILDYFFTQYQLLKFNKINKELYREHSVLLWFVWKHILTVFNKETLIWKEVGYYYDTIYATSVKKIRYKEIDEFVMKVIDENFKKLQYYPLRHWKDFWEEQMKKKEL
jgi:hypothetical protein